MQNLQDLSIYVLRELARRTGVSSPTSKRKEQLISEITAITDGKQKPTFSSKFGRPPKSFAYEIPNNIVVGEKDKSKSLAFNQDKIEFLNKDMHSVCGFVQIVNNIAFLLVQNNNYVFVKCLIPAMFVTNHKLKNGDKLVAEIEGEEANLVVKEVLNINGYPVLKMPNIKAGYESISHILPFNKIEFANAEYNSFNIMCGENIYLYGNNNNQNTITCVNYLNSCSADVKIYVNLSVAEKNKIFIKELKQCEMFVSNLTDSVEYSKEILALAIERAKEL